MANYYRITLSCFSPLIASSPFAGNVQNFVNIDEAIPSRNKKLKKMAAADNNDTILAENGIFEVQDEERFVIGLTCFICKKDAIVEDYQEHIKKPSHVGTLERFGRAFERRDETVGCKVCGKELKWSMVKDHAFWHTIPPWYEPVDRYRRFFANQMLEWETQFYCYPCDVILPEWSTAYAHIAADAHKASMEAVQEITDESAPYSAIETLCESLVSEGFVSGSEKDVICRICSRLGVRLTDLFTHIQSPQHSESKQKLVSKLKERYLRENIEKSPTESLPEEKLTTQNGLNDSAVERKESPGSSSLAIDDLPSASTSDKKSSSDDPLNCDKLQPYIYIIPQTDTDCYCKLCDVKLIGQTSIDYHVTSMWHTSALKKHGCDKISVKGGGYYCECCDWYIPDLDHLHRHVKEHQHVRALSGKREMPTITEILAEIPKSSENASHHAPQSLSNDYIEMLNNVDFCCRICSVLLSSQTLVDEHVVGLLHQTNARHYGLDSYIVLIDGKRYRCECCNYVIPSINDVCQHTMSTAHQSFLNSSIRQERPVSTKASVKIESTEQLGTTCPSLNSYYMVTLNSTSVDCKLCNIVLSGQQHLNDHLLGEQHKAAVEQYGCHNVVRNQDDSYYCKACKCKIYSPQRMLYHVKGYTHMKRVGELQNHKFPVKDGPKPLLIIGRHATSHSSSNDSSPNRSNGLFPSEGRPPPPVQPVVKDSITVKPNAIVLSQYGGDSYVTSIGRDKYHCSICNCEIPKPENIYGHVTGTRHKNNAKDPVKNTTQRDSSWTSPCRYIVKSSDTDFRCQVCDETLSSKAVANHAAGDQHAASLKRYGCQNISPRDGIDYYCKSCSCKIPGLPNVFLHIKGTKHRGSLSNSTNVANNQYCRRMLLRDASQMARQEIRPAPGNQSNDSSSEAQVPVESQATVLSEYTGDRYIKPLGGGKYRCECCDCFIPSLDNIYVHTTGNKHRSFVGDSTEKPSHGHSPYCRYIAQLSDTHFRCSICDLALSGPAAVKNHADGEQHAAALNRYACTDILPNFDNTYHCRRCRCKIPSLANVYLHIKAPRHINSLAGKRSETAGLDVPKSNVNPIEAGKESILTNRAGLSGESVTLTYVLQLGEARYICKLCNLSLIGQSTVDDHLASTTHANARDKYRCDDISPLERGKHYCGCCKCELPNLDGVYRHIKGVRHSEHLLSDKRTASTQVAKPVDEERTSRGLDVNQAVSSPVTGPPTVVDNSAAERTNDAEKISGNSAIEQPEKTILTEKVYFLVPGASSPKQQSVSSNIPNETFSAFKIRLEQSKSTSGIGKVDDTSANAKTNSRRFAESCAEACERSSFDLENESFNGESCYRANEASPASSQVTSRRNTNAGRKPRAPRKTNVQKVTEAFDFDNDYIHDMKDKLNELNLGARLSLPVDSKNVYCLVCRTNVEVELKDYPKHLSSLEHCENFEILKQDHALFEVVPGQFSDFDLALQYMEEISDDRIQCFVCHEEIENVDCAVQSHFADGNHERRCTEMQKKATEEYAEILSGEQCDWYNVHKYRCEPCSANFRNEFVFAKHLSCIGHEIFAKKTANDKRQLIYDFCSSCSLLWYGYQSTYARHCDTPTHKWIMRDGHCVSPDLPKSAQLLLATAEEYIEATVDYLDDVLPKERRKEESLMSDVEKVVKPLFPRAKIYSFGSRASGTSSPDSDIDLFLDYGESRRFPFSAFFGTLLFIYICWKNFKTY